MPSGSSPHGTHKMHSDIAKKVVADQVSKSKAFLPIEYQRVLDSILEAAARGSTQLPWRSAYPAMHRDLIDALVKEGYKVEEAGGAMTISWATIDKTDAAEASPLNP